jgi:hypothetical protein
MFHRPGHLPKYGVFLLCSLAAGCSGSGHGSVGSLDGGHGGTGGENVAGSPSAGAENTGASGGSVLAVGGAAGSSPSDIDAGCHRDISLTAVTLGAPQPFDLVIVADNSDSLSWSHDDLSAGLRDFLTNVKGRSVRVFLVTSTQYGASSAAARDTAGDDPVGWKNPSSGKAYTDPVTDFSAACTDPTGASITCPATFAMIPYDEQGTWQFELPKPIAVLTPDSTDADFAAQQKAVVDGILSLGGGGSPDEQPVCTLARYIGQSSAVLPKNAVFLIISDEDDTSLPKDCLAGYHTSQRATGTSGTPLPCSTACDAQQYTVTGVTHMHTLGFQCTAFDDLGNAISGTTTAGTVNLDYVKNCDGFTGGPCTDAESQQANVFCDSGKKVVDCQRVCATSNVLCSVTLPNGSPDACTQPFMQGGSSYASIDDYCAKNVPGVMVDSWSDCSQLGIRYDNSQQQFSGGYVPQPIVYGTSAADLVHYFRTQADTALGPEHYMVEAIVLEPGYSCPLGPGQSYAKNLADLVGDQTKLFPLCQPYAKALDAIWNFAQTLVQTDFSVPLKADEHLTSVHVIGQNGSDRTLTQSEYDYDAATQTLKVEPASLGATDANLRLEITSDCRPIIR